MVILDTNVISEPFRPYPAQSVIDWLESLSRAEIYVTAISEAETFRGIELMLEGRRRDGLRAVMEGYFRADMKGKILNFDSAASRHYAQIAAIRKQMGRPILEFDAQIAAITRSVGASLATRNSKDFEHCGIPVIDPWLVQR